MAQNLIGFEKLPQTIPHFCFEAFRRHNKRDALAYKIDDVWNISKRHRSHRACSSASRWACEPGRQGGRPGRDNFGEPARMVVCRPRDTLACGRSTYRSIRRRRSSRSGTFWKIPDAKMLFISGKKLWKHAEAAIQSVEQLEKMIFFDATASLKTTAVRSRSRKSKSAARQFER